VTLGEESEALRGPRGGEAGEPGVSTKWRRVLVWLFRLLSAMWLAKGLLAWGVIFGVAGGGPPFETRLLSFQAIIVYFAVIDLVAAVGLWLTSSWGGVLWLLAALSQLLLGFFFPRLIPLTPLMIGSYLGLMAAYFAVSWAAENEAG
jgi:hypothetical protein